MNRKRQDVARDFPSNAAYKPDAANPAIASRLQAGHHRRGVGGRDFKPNIEL